VNPASKDDNLDTTLNASYDAPPVSDQQQCPRCGLWLSKSVTMCPQDGTRLFDTSLQATNLQGTYEFIHEIASGGMGVLFKARHVQKGNFVAIKVLKGDRQQITDHVKRFKQEAKAATKLHHPNIVTVHEFGFSEQSMPYIVMDFVEGIPLSAHIKQSGYIAIPEAMDICLQIADGLDHAHSRNVLHRDMKPSNIMLSPAQNAGHQVKIVDFGIAKMLDGEGGSLVTQSGEVFGSPPYLSPEQALGKKVDKRADVYSLGCMLFEMLTGKPPFMGDSAMSTIHMQIVDPPPTLAEAAKRNGFSNLAFSPVLEYIVQWMLAKDPQERYRTVNDVKADLEAFNSGRMQVPPNLPPKGRRRSLSIEMPKLANLGVPSAIEKLGINANSDPTASLPTITPGERQELKKLTRSSPDQPLPVAQNVVNAATRAPADSTGGKLKVALIAGLALIPLGFLVFQLFAPVPPAPTVSETPDSILLVDDSDKVSLQERDRLLQDRIRQEMKHSHGTRCNLAGYQFGNPQALEVLQDCKNVSYLHLERTDTKNKDIEYFKHMPLTDLNLADTNVAGSDYIEDLPKTLAVLKFGGTRVGDTTVKQLQPMPDLHELDLSATDVSDSGLAFLDKSPHLDNLNLSNNPTNAQNMGITDAGIPALLKLAGLKTLNLSETSITDKGVMTLAPLKLEYLYLNHDGISKAGLMALSGMHSLKELHICDCKNLHPADIDEFRKLNSCAIFAQDSYPMWDALRVTRRQG
jgi:serine/threonine protein kinase